MSMYDYSATQPPPPATSGGVGEGWEYNQINKMKGSAWNPAGESYQFASSSRPPPQLSYSVRTAHVEPNPNLYIHNVPKDAKEEEIKELFSAFGTVEKIRLKVNQKIGPQAVYAFVTFSNTAEAQLALRRMNGYEMRSRRLRIEFQRFREDDQRFHTEPNYAHTETVNDLYTQQPTKMAHRSDSMTRRKRTQMPHSVNHYMPGMMHQNNDPAMIGTYKRQRHHVSPPSYYPDHHMQYPSFETRSQADASASVDQEQTRTMPTVVLLCELLRPLYPELFDLPASQHHQANKGDISRPTQAPASLPVSQLPPQDVGLKQGSIIWSGNLVRNGKKKAPIDLCYLAGGSPIPFVPQTLQTLNISHRSTWDDLLRKAIHGTCYLKISDREVNDDGTFTPLTPQRVEASCRTFSDHMQYLRAKERAGVITLPNNFHLYVIPTETAVFDKYNEPLHEHNLRGSPHALGLFITGSTFHGPPTGTPANPAYQTIAPPKPADSEDQPPPLNPIDQVSSSSKHSMYPRSNNGSHPMSMGAPSFLSKGQTQLPTNIHPNLASNI